MELGGKRTFLKFFERFNSPEDELLYDISHAKRETIVRELADIRKSLRRNGAAVEKAIETSISKANEINVVTGEVDIKNQMKSLHVLREAASCPSITENGVRFSSLLAENILEDLRCMI